MFFLKQPVSIQEKIYDALIVGSGAAGYNCALHLFDKGTQNVAVITENRLNGISRNTGSDKQTYYKMSCAGNVSDSPLQTAQTLFEGLSMDGDIALCEAAHSIEEFFHLVSIGVDFPRTKYGEFAGYKTDNDPLQRASSIGPYTSKKMTECLEAEVFKRKIQVIDKTRAVKILIENGRAFGLICFENSSEFKVYFSKNIVFACGGPAGIYKDTVYPVSHFGASGVLAREGVVFANIAEWQHGICSTKFRWNLSGSYQQVIPRYISVDENGKERDFLNGYFPNMTSLAEAVFLKGYQWPFDPQKIPHFGSSLIDLAVFIERRLKKRKVFLDFTENPKGNEKIGFFDLSKIGKTAFDYLNASDAVEKTPIERLLKINPQAFDLYKSHKIDLSKERIEIDVLPQHNNGGAEVNIWWETSIKNLFAVGECAGTHGAGRPGGAALNAGQVGGLRAASYISKTLKKEDAFFENSAALKKAAQINLADFEKDFDNIVFDGKSAACAEILKTLQENNSAYCSFFRDIEGVKKNLLEIKKLSKEKIPFSGGNLTEVFKMKEIFIMTKLLNETILYYAEKGGKSRGSYILGSLFDIEKIKLGVEIDGEFSDKIILSKYKAQEDAVEIASRNVRALPQEDYWFEKVWKEFLQGYIN